MGLLDTLRDRHSIRKYEARAIAPEIVLKLREALLRSPSSRNLQPWRFVFVTGRERLAALSRARATSGLHLAQAALGVVVCGDDGVSDCWVEDCAIASIVLQLAATELGLGSCWIQLRGRAHADGRPAEEHVREILDLPPNLRVLCAIAIGHPAEVKPEVPAEKLAWDKVLLAE